LPVVGIVRIYVRPRQPLDKTGNRLGLCYRQRRSISMKNEGRERMNDRVSVFATLLTPWTLAPSPQPNRRKMCLNGKNPVDEMVK
jgi:hypothetical protein